MDCDMVLLVITMIITGVRGARSPVEDTIDDQAFARERLVEVDLVIGKWRFASPFENQKIVAEGRLESVAERYLKRSVDRGVVANDEPVVLRAKRAG